MDNQKIILEKAIELFEKKGIRNVTMDDIASQLGMSKRTIYEQYAKKENIIADYLEEDFKMHRAFQNMIQEKSLNAIEILLYSIKHDCKDENPVHNNNMKEIQKYYPKVFKTTILKNRDEKIYNLAGIIIRGQKEEVIRQDINALLVSKLFAIQILYFLDHDFEGVETQEEVYRTMFISFTRGIATLKGYLLIDELINV